MTADADSDGELELPEVLSVHGYKVRSELKDSCGEVYAWKGCPPTCNNAHCKGCAVLCATKNSWEHSGQPPPLHQCKRCAGEGKEVCWLHPDLMAKRNKKEKRGCLVVISSRCKCCHNNGVKGKQQRNKAGNVWVSCGKCALPLIKHHQLKFKALWWHTSLMPAASQHL